MKLIDADKLLGLMSDPMFKEGFRETMKVIIKNTPTVDAVPVVRGEWNPIFNGADTCKCSVCKSEGFSDSDFGFIATPYCPNCGAEMESEGST